MLGLLHVLGGVAPGGWGATCTVCFEKRRSQLKLVEPKAEPPFCHGCSARVTRMDDIPESIDALRIALRRDRRYADKRSGKVDHRIFPRERRVGERRTPPRDAFADTDPRIRLAELDDVIIELHETDLEDVEQTQVRAKLGVPAPPDGAAAAAAAAAAAGTDPSAAR